MSHLYTKLKDLNVAVQELSQSSAVSPRDLALLEEAQHACDVGTEFALNHRPIQATYAYAFAELCMAMVQGEVRSVRLRAVLEDLVK